MAKEIPQKDQRTDVKNPDHKDFLPDKINTEKQKANPKKAAPPKKQSPKK